MADELNPIIKAYRKGETLPTKFDRTELVRLLNGVAVARATGEFPEVGVKTLGDKVLLEGRADAGTNEFNRNNKSAKEMYDFISQKLPETFADPTYAAAVVDKAQVAKRLGIPFETAWNGTGKTKEADGARHTARAEQMSGAIDDPRNAVLKDIISRGVSGNLTSQEQALTVPWDTLRSVFAGLQSGDYLTMENMFTRKAKEGVQENVYSKIKELGIPNDRATEVLKDLQSPAETLNILPKLWQQAAGIKTQAIPELSKYTPDTINVLNAIIGNR